MRWLLALLLASNILAEIEFRDPLSQISFKYPSSLIKKELNHGASLIAADRSGFPNINALRIAQEYDLAKSLQQQNQSLLESYLQVGIEVSIVSATVSSKFYKAELQNNTHNYIVYIISACQAHFVTTISTNKANQAKMNTITSLLEQTLKTPECLIKTAKTKNTFRLVLTLFILIALISFIYIKWQRLRRS